MRNKHFTLIELLVVIAIIAVIASMLLPALAMARSKARDTKCLNQHKQIMLACAMYDDEYNGWLPENPVQGNAIYAQSKSSYVGLGRLYDQGYLNAARSFWCASESRANLKKGSSNGNGYAMFIKTPPTATCLTNIMYRCGYWKDGSNIVRQNNPSERSAAIVPANDGVAACASSVDSGSDTSSMIWSDLHTGRGMNICFIDGSAMWFPYVSWMPSLCKDAYYDRYRWDYSHSTLRNLAYRAHGYTTSTTSYKTF